MAIGDSHKHIVGTITAREEDFTGQAGLNENLAREIMELHTVGTDGGYTQANVMEFARALTGWSIPTNRGGARAQRAAMRDEPGENGFVLRAVAHEPEPRTVLDKTYAEGGTDQGEAILRDLATRPETARRLVRRNIARHFVADEPPAALVDRLETAWPVSRGNLTQAAIALITAPEAWDPQPVKKTPCEFIVSSHRAWDPAATPAAVAASPDADGPTAYRAPSPEGWPDTAADWAGPTPGETVELGRGRRRRGPEHGSERGGGRRARASPVRTQSSGRGPRGKPPRGPDLFLMSLEFQRR